MSWLGLLVLPLALYLAFKVAGVALKLLMGALVLVAGYWFAAPLLGWPSVSDLVYVLGPDLGGRRMEEFADPGVLARSAGDYVVERAGDEVMQRVAPDAAPDATPDATRAPSPDAGGQARPEPLPEPLPARADDAGAAGARGQPNSRDGSV